MRTTDLHTPSQYMKPQDAAEYLCVSKSFLDKLRSHGGGPKFIKVGSRIRYSVEDLDVWMLARRYSSTSEFSDALAA